MFWSLRRKASSVSLRRWFLKWENQQWVLTLKLKNSTGEAFKCIEVFSKISQGLLSTEFFPDNSLFQDWSHLLPRKPLYIIIAKCWKKQTQSYEQCQGWIKGLASPNLLHECANFIIVFVGLIQHLFTITKTCFNMVVYYLFESYMDALNHPPFRSDQERLQDFPLGPLWMLPTKLQIEPQFSPLICWQCVPIVC